MKTLTFIPVPNVNKVAYYIAEIQGDMIKADITIDYHSFQSHPTLIIPNSPPNGATQQEAFNYPILINSIIKFLSDRGYTPLTNTFTSNLTFHIPNYTFPNHTQYPMGSPTKQA